MHTIFSWTCLTTSPLTTDLVGAAGVKGHDWPWWPSRTWKHRLCSNRAQRSHSTGSTCILDIWLNLHTVRGSGDESSIIIYEMDDKSTGKQNRASSRHVMSSTLSYPSNWSNNFFRLDSSNSHCCSLNYLAGNGRRWHRLWTSPDVNTAEV